MTSISNVGSGILRGSYEDSSPMINTRTAIEIPDGESPAVGVETLPLIADGSSPTIETLSVPPLDYTVSVTSGLDFSQAPTSLNNLTVFASNSFDFDDQGRDSKIPATASNTITVSQLVVATKTFFATVSNTLNLSDHLQRTYVVNLVTGFDLSGEGIKENYLFGNLTLTQVLTAERATPLISRLSLSQSIQSLNNLNVTASNTLSLSGTLAALRPDNCSKSRFDSLTIPEVTFTRAATILLQCATESIVLKIPELGNTELLESKSVLNESRAGVFTTFRNPIWPSQTTLSFSLSMLTRAKALELQDFLYGCLGLEVMLTDHDSRVWVGVIQNPEAMTSEFDNVDCDYDISLVFVGRPQ